jgi:hypothetical protein
MVHDATDQGPSRFESKKDPVDRISGAPIRIRDLMSLYLCHYQLDDMLRTLQLTRNKSKIC